MPRDIAKRLALIPRQPANTVEPKALPWKKSSALAPGLRTTMAMSCFMQAHEQELINKVSELNEEHKQQNRELQRKEKALAEGAVTKKAQAIWGDKEK